MLPVLGFGDHRAVGLDSHVHSHGLVVGFGMWFGFGFASVFGFGSAL